jgi:hypothetical protein
MQRLIALVFSVTFAFFSSAALAQFDECGGPPNRNVDYSKEFYKAVSSLHEQSDRKRFGHDGEVSYAKILGIQGAWSYGKDKTTFSEQKSTESESISLVQREIAKERVAVVAECLYYMCKARARSSPSDIQLSFDDTVSRICTMAMGGKDASALSAERIIPIQRMSYVQALDDKRPVEVSVTLAVKAKDDVIVIPPRNSPLIRLSKITPQPKREGANLRFEGGAQYVFTFLIARPKAALQLERFVLTYLKGAGEHIELKFAIASRERDQLPENCDALTPAGDCGRCTLKFASEAREASPIDLGICPRMAGGAAQAKYKVFINWPNGCAGGRCADFESRVLSMQGQEIKGSAAITFNDDAVRETPFEGTISLPELTKGNVGFKYEISKFVFYFGRHDATRKYPIKFSPASSLTLTVLDPATSAPAQPTPRPKAQR